MKTLVNSIIYSRPFLLMYVVKIVCLCLSNSGSPPTTDPPTNDPIVIFKRLGKRKIFILENTLIAKKDMSLYYLLYLMNNICLHNFERRQKKKRDCS